MRVMSQLSRVLCLAAILVSPVSAATISFSDFSDVSQFTFNGAAATIHGGGTVSSGGQAVLRLTDSAATGGITGSIFYSDVLELGPDGSFSTFFQFRLSSSAGLGDSDGIGGDGFMFVLQGEGPNAIGTGGGYLGFGHGRVNEQAAIMQSFGVEFDTYDNGDLNPPDGDSILDPNGNHIGVNTNGSLVSLATAIVSERLNNGAIWNAWIDYDGMAGILGVRLSQTLDRPDSAVLTRNIDLLAEVGTSSVFAGFTSGVAGAGGDHEILSWEFNQPVSEPVTILLMVLGLVGLLAIRGPLSHMSTRLT